MKTTIDLVVGDFVTIIKHTKYAGMFDTQLSELPEYSVGTRHRVNEVDEYGESAIIGDQCLIVEAEEIELCRV